MGGRSAPTQTRAQLTEIARCILGHERAAALAERLSERARHLSLVASTQLSDDDEPALRFVVPGPGGDDSAR